MDTFEKIRACLAEQLDIEPDEITMDSNILDDFGADSLDLVDLVMALEDELRWKCRTTPSRVSTRWATWCVSSRTTPDFCADRHPASPTPWRGARFFNERFAPEGSYRMSEQKKKLVEAITPINEDFAQWYTDVCLKAELVDYSTVKGCMILRPYGYAIWENITHILDGMFKATGHENVAMPIFIPESLLQREKDHVEGFAPEVAWVTYGGAEKLEERMCVRPTSETPVLRPLCPRAAFLAGSAHEVQPVVQRGALGKDHPSLPAQP